MSCLSLPPSHPKFPSTPVLHAICAIGSLYTAAVTPPPLPDFTEYAPGTNHSPHISDVIPNHFPDEIFRQRTKEQYMDSFAEQQARCARETADRQNSLDDNLFQVLQGD